MKNLATRKKKYCCVWKKTSDLNPRINSRRDCCFLALFGFRSTSSENLPRNLKSQYRSRIDGLRFLSHIHRRYKYHFPEDQFCLNNRLSLILQFNRVPFVEDNNEGASERFQLTLTVKGVALQRYFCKFLKAKTLKASSHQLNSKNNGLTLLLKTILRH